MGNKLNSHNLKNKQTAEFVSKTTNKRSADEFIIKWHRYQNQTNPAINDSIDDLLLHDQRRVVIISLIGLYQTWRNTPTSILYSSIFMLPLKRKWVQFPMKYRKEMEEGIIGQINLFQDKNSLDEFMRLLQWKDSQNLAFWMLDDQYPVIQDNNNDVLIAPFWKYFNDKLINLYDPVTKSKYKPIEFDEKWWTLSYGKTIKSKYDVKAAGILAELYFVSMKYKSIQEILYQSNPCSLNPITSYQGGQKSDFGGFVICHNIFEDQNEEQRENEGVWVISIDYDS